MEDSKKDVFSGYFGNNYENFAPSKNKICWKKRYVYWSEESNCWESRCLNIFQRIIRFLRLGYRQTRLENFIRHLPNEVNDTFLEKVKGVWEQKYPKIAFPYQPKGEATTRAVSHLPPYPPPKSHSHALFALTHTDSMRVDTIDVLKSSTINIPFLIHCLRDLLKSPHRNYTEKEIQKIQALIAKYTTTYTIDRSIEKTLLTARTKTEIDNAIRTLKEMIIQKLKEEQTLTISTGYSATPAGHLVSLNLEVVEREGTTYVKGTIVNRGEGSQFHNQTVAGNKIKVSPHLELGETPLDEVCNSNFFDILLELNIVHMPKGDVGLTSLQATCSEDTEYSIDDFLHVLLPTWKGGIRHPQSPYPVRTSQRSGTCTMKAYISDIKETLGNDLGDFFKLKMKIESINFYMADHAISRDNARFIQAALEKTNRLIIKLQERGVIDIEQMEPFLESTKERLEEIERAKQREKEAIESGMIFINSNFSEANEYNFFQLYSGCKIESTLSTPASHQHPGTFVYDDNKSITDNLAESNRIIRYLQKQNLTLEAKQVAKEVLLALPAANEKQIWESVEKPEHCLVEMTQLGKILWDSAILKEGMVLVSPNTATLLLKIFTISTVVANNKLPDDLIKYFATMVQTVAMSANLLRPNHPRYLSEFRKAHQVLYQVSGSKSNPQFSFIFEKHAGDRMILNENHFENMKQIRENPLTRYLNYLLNNKIDHDEIPCFKNQETEVSKTVILFNGHVDYYHKSHLYIALRQQFIFLFLASYMRGASHNKGAKMFSTGVGDPYQEIFYNVKNFQLENLDKPNENIFLDTFIGEPGEQLQQFMASLFDRAHSHYGQRHDFQNAQLRYQDPVAIDQIHLTEQEHRDLLSINTYDETLVPQLMTFFTRYFSRFKEREFQTIFSAFLFQKADDGSDELVIEKVVKSPLTVKNCLLDFLFSSYKKTKKIKWHDASLFCLRLIVQISAFLAENQSEQNIILLDKTYKLLNKEFEELLKSKEEHQQVLQSLISFYPYLSPYSEDTAHYCEEALNTFITSNYHFNSVNNYQLKEDFDTAMHELKDKVKEQRNQLPLWVVNNDKFQKLFSNSSLNIKFQKKEGYFLITDKKTKDSYLLKIKGDDFDIYKRLVGRDAISSWYQYVIIPPFHDSDLPKEHHPCVDGVLRKETTYWYKEGAEEVLVLDRRQQPICEVKPTQIGKYTDKHLILAKDINEHNPLIGSLLRIAPKKDLLIWKHHSSGEIDTVEIPEFKMAFNRAKVGESIRWMCVQYPGFFLDEQHRLEAFEPYQHYLVLKNKEGKKMVLLPNHIVEDLKPDFGKEPKYKDLQKQQNCKILCYHYDPTNERITSNGTEGSLYMIYLAFKRQDYRHAQTLIHKLKRNPAEWDEACCKFVSYFDARNQSSNKVDYHPYASSIRLQLKLLLLNSSDATLDARQAFFFTRDYLNYIDQQNNVFGFLLTKKEEEKCLTLIEERYATTTSETRLLSMRRQHLGLDIAGYALEPIEKWSVQEPDDVKVDLPYTWLNQEVARAMQRCLKNPAPLLLKTRPGAPFILNFLYYYKILSNHTEGDQLYELLECLRFSRFDPNGNVQTLRRILINRVHKPLLYPSFEELQTDIHTQGLDKTIQKLIEQQELCSHLRGCSLIDRIPTKRMGTDFKDSLLKATKPPPHDAQTELLLENIPDHLLDESALVERNKQEKIETDLRAIDQLMHVMSLRSPEPCVQQEFKRIQEGLKIKKRKLLTELSSSTKLYALKRENCAEVREKIAVESLELAQKIEERKEKILEVLHDYKTLNLKAEMQGTLLQPLSLKQLLLAFARKEEQKIYTSNPALTAEDVKNIKQWVGEYLLLSTTYQKQQRALKELNGIETLIRNNAPEETIAHACEHVVETCAAQRVYEPKVHPELLVFEFFNNVRLRQEQYEALIALTSENATNMDFEARTGFGKSKVMIPLWLYLTSRKDTLAMMTVPASLFEQQVSHLKTMLGDALEQSVVPVVITRKQANDMRYLKRLNERLERAKRKGMCVLTTIQSMHNLANLKLKEEFLMPHGQKEVQRELIAIRQKLMHQLSNFFDESRECFDVRRRFDYAVGQPLPVNEKHCQSVGEMYETLILNPQSLATWNFEFLPEHAQSSTKSFTEKEYRDCLHPTFIDQIIQKLEIPKRFHAVVKEDLKGHYTSACESFYQTLSPDKLKKYALYKEQLTVYLARTLNRNCGESYDLHPNSAERLAIPFDRGAAKERSEFSTLDDLLNFTIQANLKRPFSHTDIERFIDTLKLKNVDGTFSQLSQDKLMPLYFEIARSAGVDLDIFTLRTEDIEKVRDFLNHRDNIQLKLKFTYTYILPRIKIYEKKITSNPYTLVNALDKVQGASGTVNTQTLHPDIKPFEDPSAPIDNLLALWKTSKDNVFTIAYDKAEKILASILTKPDTKDYTVLIDTAGVFRDLDNEQVARLILNYTEEKQPHIEAVSYYDDKGNNLVIERDSLVPKPIETCGLPQESIYVYFPQSSTVGADTPISPTAKGLVTVGKATVRDQFLQGVGRLRGLNNGQSAGFLVFDEEKELIQNAQNTNAPFGSLLQYVTIQQGEQKGKDAFFSLRLYCEALIEREFSKAMESMDPQTALKEKAKEMEALLIEITQSDPLAKLREDKSAIPISQAKQQLWNSVADRLKQLFKTSPTTDLEAILKEIYQKFQAFADDSKFPTTINMSQNNEGISNVEAEVDAAEALQEQEVEQESEGENEQINDNAVDLPTPYFDPALPIVWDGDYRKLDDPQVTSLPNWLNTSCKASINFTHLAKDPVRIAWKPAYQYLLIRNRKSNTFCYVALDLYDAKCILKKMENKQRPDPHRDFFLMSEDAVLASDSEQEGVEVPVEMRIIAKLYGGVGNLDAKETKLFKEMPKEQLKQLIDSLPSHLIMYPYYLPLLKSLRQIHNDK